MNALDYLNSEKNLWHFMRSTNVNNNNDSVLCIYERHEQHLGNNFCETSVSEAFSQELHFMEWFIWCFIDDIRMSTSLHNICVGF